MGFGVGQRFAERYSRDHPYLDSSLDVVKLLCKELWMLLFKKQIDKLQTNYKGQGQNKRTEQSNRPRPRQTLEPKPIGWRRIASEWLAVAEDSIAFPSLVSHRLLSTPMVYLSCLFAVSLL